MRNIISSTGPELKTSVAYRKTWNSETAKRLDNIFQDITNSMKNHRRPHDSTFKNLAIQKKLRRCCLKVDTLRPASLKKKKKLNKETPAQVFFLRILKNFSNHLFNRTLLGDCFKLLLWSLFKLFAGVLDEFLRIFDPRLFVKLVLGKSWAKQQEALAKRCP